MFGWFKPKPKPEIVGWTPVISWTPGFPKHSRSYKGFIVGEVNELGERRIRVVKKCKFLDDETFNTQEGIDALKWENKVD